MSVSPHRRQWLTLAVVALGVFVTALDNSIVNVALPSIQDDLQLGLPGVAWVVNSYIWPSPSSCSPPDAWPTPSAAGDSS